MDRKKEEGKWEREERKYILHYAAAAVFRMAQKSIDNEKEKEEERKKKRKKKEKERKKRKKERDEKMSH